MRRNQSEESGMLSMLGAVHILCAVRDRQCLRPLIAELDDAESCIFDIVTNGTQAVERCLKEIPDILVIDAVLPGLDGLGVVDRLQCELEGRMPRIIGGARTPFSQSGFLRRGIGHVVPVPWDILMLRCVILQEMAAMQAEIDWQALGWICKRAGVLLERMGMSPSLKGYTYLSCAAALAYENEARVFAVSREIYAPIAARYDTTKENVERLIRHAIESTMSPARARGVYSLFGNTIDPAKGKPTNAQAIALLVQRLRANISEAV